MKQKNEANCKQANGTAWKKTRTHIHTCWYLATLSSNNRSSLVASLRNKSNSREACSGVMPYAAAVATTIPPPTDEDGADDPPPPVDDNNDAPSKPKLLIGPLPELCILSLLGNCCCCWWWCCSWTTPLPLPPPLVEFEFELLLFWPTTRRRNGKESDDDEDGMVEIYIFSKWYQENDR